MSGKRIYFTDKKIKSMDSQIVVTDEEHRIINSAERSAVVLAAWRKDDRQLYNARASPEMYELRTKVHVLNAPEVPEQRINPLLNAIVDATFERIKDEPEVTDVLSVSDEEFHEIWVGISKRINMYKLSYSQVVKQAEEKIEAFAKKVNREKQELLNVLGPRPTIDDQLLKHFQKK